MRLSLLPMALWALCAGAADWPTFLGASRDGCSQETGLLKRWPDGGPKLLWKNDAVGEGWSSVAVVGKRLYTTGNAGGNVMLICLDVATGREIWRAAQAPAARHGKYSGARATPTVDGDRIYLTGGNGELTCQRTADGRMLWRKDLRKDFGGKVGGWLYAESVSVLGKLAVVTPGGEHPVVALDKITGEPVWRSDVPAIAGYSSWVPITVDGETVLVNGSQSGLIVIDPRDGKELFRHSFAANNVANAPTPAFSDGYLFWAVGYNKGAICLTVTRSGGAWRFEEAWTSHDFTCHPGNYVVAAGRIYDKGRGGLVCADLKSGAKLWSEHVGAGETIWADGRVYSYSDAGGKMTLVDPDAADGRTVGFVQVAGNGNSWAHPAIADGMLYVRYDTNLYCFTLKAP